MAAKPQERYPESLTLFHPAVARWFASRFAGPTRPQELGWPAISSGRDTLIAAPTGSGKTLAAFLWCIDSLVRQSLDGALTDETQVVYVSPLKALSNDIQKNLSEPLAEICGVLRDMGLPVPDIRVLVRTGDTPASQRQAMTRKPPHILVTTPETLYILLTSQGGRGMLRTVRTVIVDEIHAVARDKRGSHLSLSLERLDALTPEKPVRIGLSATQRPIEEMGRFLVGTPRIGDDGRPDCAIIDEGHVRAMDLALEMPGTPLAAVCSNETWEEIYDRLAELIREQRTTLVFVNTRRLAERLTFHLVKRLGEGKVTAHHGSLSREQRLHAEQRLKAGDLQALVATASLELGIDIGTIDLACQISSTRAMVTFLQRAGRSGHTLGVVPRGRLFPLTRDDLVECAALLSAVRQGQLDRLTVPERPLDILAQQIVAAVACEDWEEDALYDTVRRAYPFRNLSRKDYDQIVRILSEGFVSSRGRTGAYVHYDGVGRRLSARRGARMAAITSGGAIPETADYQVVLEPQSTLIGTVNEDFAIESIPGDIFQLGSSSWRILRVEPGRVRVKDAHGLPPTMPFWLGEAPSRTDELTTQVAGLRKEVEDRLGDPEPAVRWLDEEVGIGRSAAEQIVEYLEASFKALGALPTRDTIILERFFDETGGMQLVLHAPLGGRINRAWGLALRKRFCRSFNFELQAAANEDAIVISLGPQHSFPLDEVFSYLRSESVESLLVQALLAAPMFQARWRWNVTRSLAVLRQNKGKKVPAPIQRMRADDLLAAAFPAQTACAENIVGDIEVPDHPIVRQSVEDCLNEAMDSKGLVGLLAAMERGQVRLIARDTTEPSPLAHEIINAKPYAFLDDAPLEERRTQAVMTRRTLDAESASDLGALDADAVERVREQAWPEVEEPDELHDALVLLGYLTQHEVQPWVAHLEPLIAARRAARLTLGDGQSILIAAERLPLIQALFPTADTAPSIEAPARERAIVWTREEALADLVRGRLEGLGPVTTESLAGPLALPASEIEMALAGLERDGFAMRGRFTPGATLTEWCDRRLLARIHRYTMDRLRKEIEPATAAEFTRFLFAWQHVHPDYRVQGPAGLAEVVSALQGYEMPAGVWEGQVLSARSEGYSSLWLDQFCLSGQVVWGRLHPSTNGNGRRSSLTRALPITLLFRDQLPAWLATASSNGGSQPRLSELARQILEHLGRRGASFHQDLVRATRRLPTEVKNALGELVAGGFITGDGFGNLRGLVSRKRQTARRPRPRQWVGPFQAVAPPETSGRWSLFRVEAESEPDQAEMTELVARQLLRRYGVIFHKLTLRETGLPQWRDLLRVYRRLEARGEIRGGRFVAGFSGEQYALPEAVEGVRAMRRKSLDGRLLAISAADPLNLVGITAPGDRVPSVANNRVIYRDGVPVAARVAGSVRYLQQVPERDRPELVAALRE